VSAAIAAAGGVACALSIAAPAFHGLALHPLDQTIHAGVAAVYIGAGVIALLRRPANPTGLLMSAVGFLWLVDDLSWIHAPTTFTLVQLFGKLYQTVLAHLALVYPSGRLSRSLERAAIVALYAWAVGNNLAWLLFYDPHMDTGCVRCPDNLLLLHGNRGIAQTISDVTTVVTIVLIVWVAALIVRHWRQATRAAQHVMAPALWTVGPGALFIAAHEVGDAITLSGSAQRIVYDYLPAGLAVLPIGFLIGLLNTRLAYAQVGAVLPELTSQVGPGRVRTALAATLHDPDLELLYWSPTGGSYVDLDGQLREPVAGPGRAVSPIEGESGPLAVMIVDKVALDEPDLLRAAVAMARLALENERLQAEVRSQLLQLRTSTTRIIEAGQDARRRIERDLHDGTQQRLLALSMTLARARARADSDTDPALRTFLDRAANDVQQAIDELRELARGIHPMLLTQEGLASALRALAERAPLPVEVTAPTQRFPETIEATAYFLVSEAVTNAARHSCASAVSVAVAVEGGELTVQVRDNGIGGADETGSTNGSGLLGMRDRVTAIGGLLRISSPVGAGTTLTARLPCG
jgi:signal transduction histidine kinase